MIQFTASGIIFVLLGEQLPTILAGAAKTVHLTGHRELWWLAVYVVGINLGVPLADTTLLNASPDRNASESVVNAAVSAGSLLKVNAAVVNGTMQSALAQSSVVSTGGVNGLNVSLVNGALIPVSLLRVTADTVSSRAQMACSAGNPVATGTSTIENLKITALGLNVPVVVNPAANTTISVAGIASVVLNE